MNILWWSYYKRKTILPYISLYLITVLWCKKNDHVFSGNHYNFHTQDTIATTPLPQSQVQTVHPSADTSSVQDVWHNDTTSITSHTPVRFEDFVKSTALPTILRDSCLANNKTYTNYEVVKNDSTKMNNLKTIQEMFNKSDLPTMIKHIGPYIPRQENGYNAGWEENEVGAKWLWQFLPATAQEYGLTVDDTQDDRTDVIKTTEATITLLHHNYTTLLEDPNYQELTKTYDIQDSIFVDLATINAHNTWLGNITHFLELCTHNSMIQKEISWLNKSNPWWLYLYMTSNYGLNPDYKELKSKSDNDTTMFWEQSSEYTYHIMKYYLLDQLQLPNDKEEFYNLITKIEQEEKIPDEIVGTVIHHSRWKDFFEHNGWIIMVLLLSIIWLKTWLLIQKKYKEKKYTTRSEAITDITTHIKAHKKAYSIGIWLVAVLALGALVYTNHEKHNDKEKTTVFPDRKPEMGLKKLTVYQFGQKQYTNPYLYDHKDDVVQPKNIDDIIQNKDHYIKIEKETFLKYFKDNAVWEVQHRAIYGWEKTQNTYREYAYINPHIRETAIEIQQEFNKRLQQAWYTKILTLQIDGLSRACDGQSIAGKNKTEFFSAHEWWIAIDFWSYEDDKFILRYDDNGTWSQVTLPEVTKKGNLILNKLLEEYRKDGKIMITPESNGVIHVVFWGFWPLPLDKTDNPQFIPHKHVKIKS